MLRFCLQSISQVLRFNRARRYPGILFAVFGIVATALLSSPLHAQTNRDTFEKQAVTDSLIPIRPGVPGKVPFWNTHARRFIYAPAFDFSEVNGAKSYRFTLTAKQGTQTFEADTPWASLAPVWKDVPTGRVDLTVEGLDRSGGKIVGHSGNRTFYRSSVFRGPYEEPPPVDYREAARRGLRGLFLQPYVQKCLKKGSKPDIADYKLYRYPSKVMGGLIRGMVLYSTMASDPREANDALRIATSLADFLISLNQPADAPLANLPPTYWKVNWSSSHVREEYLMLNSPVDAALAYLDLYDVTNNDKYLKAATRIADTYRRLQRPNGTWPLLVRTKTGEPVGPNPVVPTWIITLMERLVDQYGLVQYRPVGEKAFCWIMDHPMKRFNWDGQFEDIKPQRPYENLAREQACDVAVYLLNRVAQDRSYLKKALELLRFSEDQFVVWEAPDENQWALDDTRPADPRKQITRWKTSEWFTPCVLEQYSCYAPVARSSAIQINAYRKAYEVTGRPIYLAKAKSLANALIVCQQYHGGGQFPTWLVKSNKVSTWSNNSAYAAMAVYDLGRYLATTKTADKVVARPKNLAELRKQRNKAAHRKRRIIFNNDGNDAVMESDDARPETILNCRTIPLIGSQVDTVAYCSRCSGLGLVTHNTKLGDIFTCTEGRYHKNTTARLIEQGTDCLKITTDFCRKNNIEIFWTMRMNDTHDATNPLALPQWKKDHPDWLIGSNDNRPKFGRWSAADYAQKEVREMVYRYVEEVCQNYDVDGVELDFFRTPVLFKKQGRGEPLGREECDMMTDLVRRIRKMTEREGLKRGRPILVSVRVPDSVKCCKGVGIDMVRWLEEDLFDIMVVSGLYRVNPWETSVELGHRYDVPVYPCLSESRLKDNEAREVRMTPEGYRARAMNVWASGADGVYLFNVFDSRSPMCRELGDPAALETMDKVYTPGARNTSWLKTVYNGLKLLNRQLVSPRQPVKLKPGRTSTIDLNVGQEARPDPSLDKKPQVQLRLRVKNLKRADDLTVKLNGQSLHNGVLSGKWLEYTVDPALIQKGTNRFELTLKPNAGKKIAVEDLLLWLRYVPE